MKFRNVLLTSVAVMLTSTIAHAVENSNRVLITSIESRDTGLHGIFVDGGVPSQGCSFSDRAILKDVDPAAKTMLSVALAAMVSGKKVVLQVGDCTPVNTGYDTTAPVLKKVQIYN